MKYRWAHYIFTQAWLSWSNLKRPAGLTGKLDLYKSLCMRCRAQQRRDRQLWTDEKAEADERAYILYCQLDSWRMLLKILGNCVQPLYQSLAQFWIQKAHLWVTITSEDMGRTFLPAVKSVTSRHLRGVSTSSDESSWRSCHLNFSSAPPIVAEVAAALSKLNNGKRQEFAILHPRCLRQEVIQLCIG